MLNLQPIGLEKFLQEYPDMGLKPVTSNNLSIAGTFKFHGCYKNEPDITDAYSIEISVSTKFPKAIPEVREIGNKIPKDEKHHINPNGSLCLGSPLRLLTKLNKNPTMCGFAEGCLVPYLYSMSYKRTYGGKLIFNELEHGEAGIISDYMKMLGISSEENVLYAIDLLGQKKRIANKKACPCGCEKRLGVCKFRMKLIRYRKMAPRSWYAGHSRYISPEPNNMPFSN